MWFLLIQISLLLLAAAALGAALAWWWLSRAPEEEVGEDPHLATRRLIEDRFKALASRDDVNSASAHMAGALASLPRTDLDPVHERLMRLEQAVSGIRFPHTDLSPLISRLDAMETSLATAQAALDRLHNTDLQPLERKLDNLAMPDVDLGPVHSALLTIQLEIDELKTAASRSEPAGAQISGLSEDLRLRFADLSEEVRQGSVAMADATQLRASELASAVAGAEERLQAARASDIDALTTLVAELSAAISAIRIPDNSPVLSEIGGVRHAISAIALPATDLSPLELRLESLQRDVASIERRPVDLAPLHARLSDLEALVRTLPGELATRRALEPVERQIAELRETLRDIPRNDIGPVLDAVYSIDGRQDLIAVENRINAIEYSLAALHHMLRTRPDAPPPRPAPRPAPEPVAAPMEQDPVALLRRPGDQANLLIDPGFGPADDLEQINGVGPILASLLRDIGVYYFWQVAEWTPAQADWVDSLLQHFRGRIRRDDWVGHARQLAALPTSARRPATRIPRRPGV